MKNVFLFFVLVFFFSGCGPDQAEKKEFFIIDSVKPPAKAIVSKTKTPAEIKPRKHHLYIFCCLPGGSNSKMEKARKKLAGLGMKVSKVKHYEENGEGELYFYAETVSDEDSLKLRELKKGAEACFVAEERQHYKVVFSIEDVNFPGGKVSLQETIDHAILHKHYGEKMNLLIKENPVFAAARGSFFTKGNTDSLFFFLTRPNGSTMSAADEDNAFLAFLREKNKAQMILKKSSVGVHDDIGNPAPFIQYDFKNLSCFLFVRNSLKKEKIVRWTKEMDGDAAKWYSAEFEIDTIGVSGHSGNESSDFMINYLGFPGVVLMSDKQVNFFKMMKNLKQQPLSMADTSGKMHNGFSFDFNEDKIPDIFWYVEKIKTMGVFECIARLYVNVDGKWILKNYDTVSIWG